jgi:hypothetical protein
MSAKTDGRWRKKERRRRTDESVLVPEAGGVKVFLVRPGTGQK